MPDTAFSSFPQAYQQVLLNFAAVATMLLETQPCMTEAMEAALQTTLRKFGNYYECKLKDFIDHFDLAEDSWDLAGVARTFWKTELMGWELAFLGDLWCWRNHPLPGELAGQRWDAAVKWEGSSWTSWIITKQREKSGNYEGGEDSK